MRHVLALLALGTILAVGVTAAPAQTPYPSTTPPSTQPIQPPPQPSQAPGTDTTTPVQSPSPAPAQVPGSQPAPSVSPSTQDTQAPAPAQVTTPQHQLLETPSKEVIDQRCYQGYGPGPAAPSASAPQIRPALSAQSGGTPVTQGDETQKAVQTPVVPSSLCGGWVGAPAGRFPNVSLTPEFPIMYEGGIEMLPVEFARQRWDNFEGGR